MVVGYLATGILSGIIGGGISLYSGDPWWAILLITYFSSLAGFTVAVVARLVGGPEDADAEDLPAQGTASTL